jgi:hypothetical protein
MTDDLPPPPTAPPTPIDDACRLWISGVIDDWQAVHDCGITVIIDLEAGVDRGVPTLTDKILYVYLPIDDGKLPDLGRLHAVADLAASLLRQGHRVLSHCGMGLNRSALVAGLALVRLGMPPEDALTLIRARRPGALYNDDFTRHLLGHPPA